MKPIEFTNRLNRKVEGNFLGQRFCTEEIPFLWMEITEANIDFDHCRPIAAHRAEFEAGGYTTFDCKKVKVTWFPEFDWEAGMVEIKPITISLDATIEKETCKDGEDDPVKTEIEVSANKPPLVVKTFDDGADRGRQYGPHTVLFMINENDIVEECHVFYS